VTFTATIVEPTDGTYVVMPLFGAWLGPFADSQPFTHTVGPMTDQPSSLGSFKFYIGRADNPYDSADWHSVSVPAPGCGVESATRSRRIA
jgi:hypothetical protein